MMTKSTNNNRNNFPSPIKDYKNVYHIPRDYDKTPKSLLPLDHYLLDNDIYSLIKQLFPDDTTWSSWAMLYKDDAEGYFSKPFNGRRDVFLLGYEINDDE